MLISPAYAQAAGGQGDFFVSLLPLILIFAVFWFLLIRPQQKRMREHREMIQALKKGDKVLTSGGIIGQIVKVEDDNTLLVSIAENVRVKVARGMISENLDKTQAQQSGKASNDDKSGGGKGILDKLLGR